MRRRVKPGASKTRAAHGVKMALIPRAHADRSPLRTRSHTAPQRDRSAKVMAPAMSLIAAERRRDNADAHGMLRHRHASVTKRHGYMRGPAV